MKVSEQITKTVNDNDNDDKITKESKIYVLFFFKIKYYKGKIRK